VADKGFKAFYLGASNFELWSTSPSTSTTDLQAQLDLAVEHVRESATERSMLTEMLLKAGYVLTSPVDSVDFAGTSGFSIADGALLVCLSDQLSIAAVEAMVAEEPVMILVLDAGFGGNDELKVNALQTVRARNQQSGTDIALRVV
jgi:adenine-specific DNA-methyltransferase